ncbi:cell division control protein 48/AAA family ATPase [Halosimplex carlsbadense 2-9-1]|uniref:Cell division control protein 48/AAA family ATPase n=1 Tax=Halosimplex carlsbadense 2-9-1 TaxID=797114 RepID=M0CPI6_9EURY|nr:AAA family ATPase [Halosimplex carlsbadense]ELZ24312.1 cell division control protein 48/AAA family ATPase [Halosimplex carlsbadense 2-9-1]
MGSGDAIEVSVEGANKRDAGRGIARVPERVRAALGVLSGDPLVIQGERATVAKAWPESGDGAYIRIDADTRANAGVNIGDTVTVEQTSVREADSLTVRLAQAVGLGDAQQESAVRRALLDRPLREGEQVHIDGVGAFAVSGTDPAGAVRVTDETDITVLPPIDGTPTGGATGGSTGGTGGATGASGASSGSTGTTASGAAAESTPDESASRTGVSYEDIGGLDDELDQVREMIELPLSNPDLFTRLGISPPRGVLLHGPPGTGKTLIARAVANEVDAYFDVISGPEVVSKYKGESEERLREAFDHAEANAPAIIFVDEIDAIAGERDEDSDMENRVVAQLLTLLDGLEDRGQVIVIGATNRVDSIDPALRRGGRFDREIEIGVPDETGRREILDVHTRGMPLAEDVDLDRVASRTHGFVGADLHTLTTEAAMHALRRTRDEPEVTREDLEAALRTVEPSAMREYVAESPTVTFDDVGGLAEAKSTLEQAVEWPLEYGPLFTATNTDPPSGVLLHGPPGTGKTLLARAVAGESGVNFIRVAGPELMDRYVGESEKAVREVFDRARQTAPAIVFFDEIDGIAGGRMDGNEVTERVVSQLLTEMDSAAENPNVVVIAATNRRDMLDDALLRPGRLEQHVEVPNPDEAGRRAILDVHTEGKPIGDDVDLDELAVETEGLSGAQIESLVRAASMRAISEVAAGVDPEEANERADDVVIGRDDFEYAIERIEPSG